MDMIAGMVHSTHPVAGSQMPPHQGQSRSPLLIGPLAGPVLFISSPPPPIIAHAPHPGRRHHWRLCRYALYCLPEVGLDPIAPLTGASQRPGHATPERFQAFSSPTAGPLTCHDMPDWRAHRKQPATSNLSGRHQCAGEISVGATAMAWGPLGCKAWTQ